MHMVLSDQVLGDQVPSYLRPLRRIRGCNEELILPSARLGDVYHTVSRLVHGCMHRSHVGVLQMT